MGCATGLVKIIVFIFNFFCSIVGLVLITLGSIEYVISQNSQAVTQVNTQSVPIFVISLGVFVFLVSFLGCCGVFQKNQCMLTTYSVILILLFVLQLAISIYGIVELSGRDNNEFKNATKEELKKSLKNYTSDNVIQNIFDNYQKKYECCGVDGPDDYLNKVLLNIANLPKSCCKNEDQQCSRSNAYHDGCFNDIYEEIIRGLKIVAYTALGLAAVELVGAFFAFCLVNSYRNENRRRN